MPMRKKLAKLGGIGNISQVKQLESKAFMIVE